MSQLFSQVEKDDGMKTLTSNISIIGDGVKWSGNLKRDIHQIRRVVYCKICSKPMDFHAVLLGKLDYKALGPTIGIFIFIAGVIYLWRFKDFSFWSAAGVSLAGALITGYSLNELEKKLVLQWKFTEEQAQKIKIKELQEERDKLYEK